MLAALIAAVAVGGVAVAHAPAAGHERAAAAKHCKRGSKPAVVGGRHRCLRAGQRCRAQRDAHYHRYGFHCAFGKLRRAHPACSDRRDNDRDGDADLADRGCVSARDGDESNPRTADLSVSITAPSASVVVGVDAAYTIGVANAGRDGVGDAAVTLRLPIGAAVVSLSPSPARCALSIGAVVCRLESIPSGGSASVTVVLRLSPAGDHSLTATAMSPTHTDPNTSNNTASAAATARWPSADVAVTASVSPATASFGGGRASYTVTVTNFGLDAAEGITVSSEFGYDGAVTGSFEPTMTTQGSCRASANRRLCALDTVAVGATVTLTIAVTLGEPPSDPATRLVLSTGVSSASTPDPNTVNNFATATLALGAAHALTRAP